MKPTLLQMFHIKSIPGKGWIVPCACTGVCFFVCGATVNETLNTSNRSFTLRAYKERYGLCPSIHQKAFSMKYLQEVVSFIAGSLTPKEKLQS